VASAFARADVALFRLARTRGHSPTLERTVARFSKLGEHAAVWLAIGAAGTAFDTPRRAAWRRATAVVAGAYLLNTAIKLLVRRRRPALAGLPPLIGTPTGLSFPSAHATSSFAAARAYGRVTGRRRAFHPLAVALAASRVYLGVHYPSDVVAGALLGSAAAELAR
jgi:membrane-associated phospholipid phosphatase